jgi:Fe-S cluster assembly iron-binding protein IscA
MNCHDAQRALNATIGGGTAPAPDVAAHLRSCEACARVFDDATLAHALRADTAPPPRAGFVDAVIATAIRAGHAPRGRIGRLAAAVAVIGLLTGVLYTAQQSAPEPMSVASQRVTLATLEGKTVRVVIDSRSAQPAATVTIDLADNLELAGFARERRIQFQTDLSAGKNLLALPLVLTDAAVSHFDVALAYGTTRRNIRVAVEPAVSRAPDAAISS